MVLFVISCTDLTPVKPGPGDVIDEHAIELARFALKGISNASYAFYRRDVFNIDTVILKVKYSDAVLRIIDLSGYTDCRRGSGPCIMPETTSTGIVQPIFTNPNPSNLEYPYYIDVYEVFDSLHNIVPLDAPAAFQEFKSLYSVLYSYSGNYVSAGKIPDNFAALKIAYSIYPLRSAYDSVEVVLASKAEKLTNDSLPSNGIYMKNYYFNSDSSANNYGLSLDVSGALSELDRYVHFSSKSGIGVKPDTVVDVYKYRNDTLKVVRVQGSCRVVYHAGTIFSADIKPDSSRGMGLRSGDTLLFSSLDSGFVQMHVMGRSGDTVVRIEPSVLKDSLFIFSYNGQLNPTILRFLNNGNTLSWSDSTAIRVMKGTISSRGGNVYINFTRRENGVSGNSFSGEMYLNLFTRHGKGYVQDPSKGESYIYEINLDVDGVSTIGNIQL